MKTIEFSHAELMSLRGLIDSKQRELGAVVDKAKRPEATGVAAISAVNAKNGLDLLSPISIKVTDAMLRKEAQNGE